MARLRLDAHEAVLGVPASLTFDRIVALEDLWGDVATRRLFDQLGSSHPDDAPAILERAIAERIRLGEQHRNSRVVLAAAQKLESARVSTVAGELDVSERSLRRAFRDTVGMSPKAFARLARFHRAVRAAREDLRGGWGRIAVDAGYYDQAHLIAEFRDLAGVTPRALLEELATGRYAPGEAQVRSPHRAPASLAR
jgi:AraC-like DNA-binding protein